MLLYRGMIAALEGSANLAVTGRPSKNRSFRYRMGDKPWQEIYKVSVQGCSKAWRFSQPDLCQAPPMGTTDNDVQQTEPKDYLIGFYDALAMIQTECFMEQFVHSTFVPVSDGNMKTLEWLHARIRNEYEHFIPKYYKAPVSDLIAAKEICLRVGRAVLFESGNVLLHSIPRNKIEGLFQQVRDRHDWNERLTRRPSGRAKKRHAADLRR